MGRFFRNDLHDQFGSWPLGYTAYGGVDVGEIIAVAAAVGDGDDSAYYEAWMSAGDRLAAQGDAVLARGHRASASALYLKAACCYVTSFHPLYGKPVDPRLVRAFRRQIATMDKAFAMLPHPIHPMRIPYDGTTMPAYFLPAEGREAERRPLVILVNGYDSTVTENYFLAAAAMSRGGFHCLWFDGPGQGEMLIEQGLPFRPDWEAVIRPVVDFALTLPHIDAGRIALYGMSLGGYLALRGASGESRVAACVADPGLRAVMTAEFLLKFGLSASQIADPATIPDSAFAQVIASSARMRWTLVQRGLWTHGAESFADYVAATLAMTLEGRVSAIRCPTLLTAAEKDSLSSGAPALFDELQCPKTLLRFTAAEGAGEHCESYNRTLANQRVLDWLEETFASTA